jgi:DNA polymerase-3 subunit epsilon
MHHVLRTTARCKALDDWMGVFSIENTARHDALGDALATAQLFLVLLVQAERQGATTAKDLAGAAAGQRWLVR